jgi:DNA-binding transcriptional ArsR family regulator
MEDEVFAALADPTRRQLVGWLAARPSTATELAGRLPITRQAVMKHLGVLNDAGLVNRERSGRQVCYRLEAQRLARATEWLAAVSARWERRLERLRRHLEEGERHGEAGS